MKKKVLIWADSPSVPTGWGNVVRFLLAEMPKDKYDFVCLGINYYGDPHDLPYKIYPAGSKHPGDIYGFSRLSEIVSREKPEILFLLNDIWVINQMLEVIKDVYRSNFPKIVIYFPADAADHDPAWYKNLGMVTKAVVYNDFGKRVAEKAKPDFKFDVIGHGVDTKTFFKSFKTRTDAKKFLFSKKEDLHNAFIFLNANRNQPRKRLDITMRAFSLFAKDKPDARLYLHSGTVDSGIDVIRLANITKIEEKLIITSVQHGIQAVPFDRLNLIYNACDVGINSGLGEGFGLCSAEHAATGALQIVPDHSALTDLYKDCGILVPANIPFSQDGISTTGKLVTPEDLANAMEIAYTDKARRTELAELGMKKFTSREFSWKFMAEQWDSLLSRL